jgi:hypothetical protein
MDRFMGLDSLMTANGIIDTKAFEAYYNTVLAGRETMDLNIAGFEWNDPQIDFTYEMLEMGDDVEVMATYVDLNSPALPSGTQTKFENLTGSIPRQKYRIVRGENDYRKELILMQEVANVARFQGRDVNVSLEEHLAKYLFTTLVDIPNAHKNSLNYQVGQMKSAGLFELTADNNPRGIKGAKFSARVPEANIITKELMTKDASTGAYMAVEGADPIEDIRAKIREIRFTKYRDVTVEVDEQFAFELFKLPSVLRAIGYLVYPNLRLSPKNDDNALAVARGLEDDAIKDYFRRLIGADEVIYQNTVVATEKLNTETKNFDHPKMKAFNEDVILIRPSGTIGKIVNVAPLRPDGSAITAGIFGGRGIVEYIYNAQTRTQDWQSELTILAVPTRPKDMYYFKGVSVANGD